MTSSQHSCPVTGSTVTFLPPDHPATEGSQKACPVTNATLAHHQDTVRPHPTISASATEADCPILSKAKQENVCPVVGTATTVLPPNHPTTMQGDVCPVTNAKLSDHAGVVKGHSAISAQSSAKDCPVLSSSANGSQPASSQGLFQPAAVPTTQCPVTGSKVTALPPDHPPTTNGETCPVTKATMTLHQGIVSEHPPVSADATAQDSPVLQQASTSATCPVVGTDTSTLPPNHPSSTESGAKCPVTGATGLHHKDVAAHPSVSQANREAKCPITGAVADHHKSIDPATANATVAQCPVTGQFADGSRPPIEIPAELAAEPIKYTLIGIPFSTFTRTAAMGLHELRIPFTQIPAKAHSEEILKYNPFGRLPVLLVEHSGRTLSMFETDSIARYLDSADDRLLRFSAKDLIKNQKVEEWIGIIASYVFPAVEKGVVKPYLLEKSPDLDQGVAEMHKVLTIVEKRMQGPYLMGFNTTWGDLFLYPILADLAATPFKKELDKYSKLSAFTARMDKRSTAKATFEGTLASGAKHP